VFVNAVCCWMLFDVGLYVSYVYFVYDIIIIIIIIRLLLATYHHITVTEKFNHIQEF